MNCMFPCMQHGIVKFNTVGIEAKSCKCFGSVTIGYVRLRALFSLKPRSDLASTIMIKHTDVHINGNYYTLQLFYAL